MKKTLFTLVAVPLVLLPVILLASCYLSELFLDADADDEPPMASLIISLGDGGTNRALISTDAPGNADYYEVVFKDPNVSTKFYQKAFSHGDQPGNRTITIPVGDYTGDTKAVLFAGCNDGTHYILLGIGYITQVDGAKLSERTDGHANTAFIGAGTHNITFTITALTGGITSPSSSTFEILGPTDDNYPAASQGTVTVSGVSYPTFPIPGYDYPSDDSTYTYNTSATSYLQKNIVGQYTVNLTSHSDAVIQTSAWTATATPYISGGGAPSGTIVCYAYGPTSSRGSVFSITNNICTFGFVVDVSSLVNSSDNGYYSVLIDAQVRALAPVSSSTYEVGSPVEWHIRGGIDDTTPDGAGSGDNFGALIILNVGASP